MDAQLGIIGAGASGLSLALLTDQDFVVLERSGRPGGHATSIHEDGWVFDRGPHIMFSREQLLLDCMIGSLGDNVHRCRRNNRVAIGGTLARYPIENDLAALPQGLRSEALISFLAAQTTEQPTPRNLAEWFSGNFGDVMVAAYFRPYNEKVWNVPLEELSMSWADRIPRPPMEDVVRGALGEVTEGYVHQLYYHYPLEGGYGALMDAWASGLQPGKVQLNEDVRQIVPADDGVKVETEGRVWQFERVVSTVPLDTLIRLVPNVHAEVSAAVSRLQVNPMIVVTLGFSGEDENKYTAVYIPDDDYLVNRVSYPGVFSPRNTPPGCFSVQAEITARRGAEVLGWPDAHIVSHVLNGLRSRTLVPEGAEVIFESVQRYDHAYVVYTREYERDLAVARQWLDDRGITIHGRFGAHEYLNVDGCLGRSIELAEKLGAVFTAPEILDRFRKIGR